MVISQRETAKEGVRQETCQLLRSLLRPRNRASSAVPISLVSNEVSSGEPAIRQEPNVLQSEHSSGGNRDLMAAVGVQMEAYRRTAALLAGLSTIARQRTGGGSSLENEQATQVREFRRNPSINRFRTFVDSVNRRRTWQRTSRDSDIPEYQYNPATFRFTELSFRQACEVMNTFDYDQHRDRIKEAIRRYSLRIYGLEDCPLEDLRIAVFFFVETHFSFQPVIELCVRHIPDAEDPNVVGVLFQRSGARARILDHRGVLEHTRYKVARNEDISWIIWNYDD